MARKARGGGRVSVDAFIPSCELNLQSLVTSVDLRVIPLGSYGVVLGMDWLSSHSAHVDCRKKTVECLDDLGRKVEIVGVQRPISLRMISTMQLKWCMRRGYQLFAITLEDVDELESR